VTPVGAAIAQPEQLLRARPCARSSPTLGEYAFLYRSEAPPVRRQEEAHRCRRSIRQLLDRRTPLEDPRHRVGRRRSQDRHDLIRRGVQRAVGSGSGKCHRLYAPKTKRARRQSSFHGSRWSGSGSIVESSSSSFVRHCAMTQIYMTRSPKTERTALRSPPDAPVPMATLVARFDCRRVRVGSGADSKGTAILRPQHCQLHFLSNVHRLFSTGPLLEPEIDMFQLDVHLSRLT
jgi:hypothetical protein